MPLFDQVELLVQAVGAQAKDEADKIVSQARQEAERLIADAEARRQQMLQRTQEEVEAQARLTARNRIDRAELESKRRIAHTKEAILNDVWARGRERLQDFRQTGDYPGWLRRMLAGALEQLQGEGFRVASHPQERRWLTPELLAEVARERGVTLEWSPEEDLPEGGFMVARADGRVRYDATFDGIMARRRESLRADIARQLWGSIEAVSSQQSASGPDEQSPKGANTG